MLSEQLKTSPIKKKKKKKKKLLKLSYLSELLRKKNREEIN